MLKIKDNVDLKELEKYGFVFEKAHGLINERYVYYDEDEQTVEIATNDKTIFVEDISGSYTFGAIVDNALSVLYDLIKADLVEKVSEIE